MGLAGACLAENGNPHQYQIANRPVFVPPPTNFVVVTPQMTAVNELNLSAPDQLNDLVVSFISEQDAPVANAGQLPPLLRTMAVKVNKEFKNSRLSTADFADMAQAIKLQNAGTREQIEYEIAQQLDQSGLSLKERLELDAALQVSTIVPMEVHLSERDVFAHSMLIRSSNAQQENADVVASTLSFVNIDGTVLFLYVFGTRADLEWTQQVSLDWASKILDANGQAGVTAKSNNTEAINKTLLGAIALVFALLLLCLWAYISRRKRPNGSSE